MDDSRFTSVTRTSTEVGTLIEVAGELDHEAGPGVRRAAAMAIVAGGMVEIDLSRVSFVDSAGLRALVDAKDCADQYRVDLRVTATTPPVQRLLGIIGIPELFGDPIAHTA